jgi:hypothetical protein
MLEEEAAYVGLASIKPVAKLPRWGVLLIDDGALATSRCEHYRSGTPTSMWAGIRLRLHDPRPGRRCACLESFLAILDSRNG